MPSHDSENGVKQVTRLNSKDLRVTGYENGILSVLAEGQDEAQRLPCLDRCLTTDAHATTHRSRWPTSAQPPASRQRQS